jgi:hypothetical protein
LLPEFVLAAIMIYALAKTNLIEIYI